MGLSYETVHLNQGDVLSDIGNDSDSLYLIINGQLDVYSSYGRFTMGPSSIACGSDCYYGIGIFTYVASENTTLEKYHYSKTSDIVTLCNSHPDMPGHLVTVNTDFVMQIIKAYLSLTLKCRQKDNTYSPDSRINKWELDKYNGMHSVPVDLSEKYYETSTAVAVAALADESRFIATLNDACRQMADFLGINLEYVPPAKPSDETSSDCHVNVIQSECGNLTYDEVIPIFSGSLRQILDYASMDEEDTAEITELMDSYCHCSNKSSTDDDFRQLRHKLSKYFYRIYFNVFTRSLYDEFIPEPVLMLLNFGFIDERLVNGESLVSLYNILHTTEDLCCNEHIFTMYSWLKHIAWGEKEPSRNSLDQSYPEYVKEQSRLGKINASEAMSNNDLKVRFEIDNMFTQSQRMTFGRASSYVPFLTQESIQRPLIDVILTSESLMKVVNNIRSIDFSAFYRPGFYTNEKAGIGRETIYREYLPDIILTPCVGTNGVMWQEIDGRDRNTPARFVFPLFCNGKIESMAANTVGKFRWELCKRIQGVYWNDITEKSLTSEYCDYLQFYKKNHDLSDSVKEKIKTTLTSCHNSFSDFFAREYETYIMYEASGSNRLNKVSRSILLRYCPFSRNIRDLLRENPSYTNAITLWENRRIAERKRIEKAISLLEKNGEEVHDDLVTTEKFLQM